MTISKQNKLIATSLAFVILAAESAVCLKCIVVLRASRGLTWRTEIHDTPCSTGVAVVAQPPASEGRHCLISVAAIPLDAFSLTPDPMYLPDAAAFRRWQETQARLYEELSTHPRVELELASLTGSRHTHWVATTGFCALKRIPEFFSTLVPSVITLLLGFFVFFRRPNEPAARVFFVFSHAMFLCALTTLTALTRELSAPPDGTTFLYQVNVLAFLVGALAFFVLTLLFPTRWFPATKDLIVFVVCLLGTCAAFWLEWKGQFGVLLRAAVLPIMAAVIVAVAAPFRAKDQLQRAQSAWMLWGLGVPAMLWTATRAPFLLGPDVGPAPADDQLFLWSLTIPVGTAVAILRYRLLDIQLLMRRTVIGVAVVGLVLVGYSSVLSAFTANMAEPPVTNSGVAVTFMTAVVLVFTMLPAQSRLEELLDQIFFRNRYGYRRLLARLPDDLADFDRPNEVARQVLNQVCQSMDVPRMVIVVAGPSNQTTSWQRVDQSEEEPNTDESSRALPEVSETEAFWKDARRESSVVLFDAHGPPTPLWRWMKNTASISPSRFELGTTWSD